MSKYQKVSVFDALYGTGHDNRLKAEQIAKRAGIFETDSTCPNTRALILELINDGYVIGANSKGYCLLQTGKEVQQYLNSLLQRQMAISYRIQAVYSAAKANNIL